MRDIEYEESCIEYNGKWQWKVGVCVGGGVGLIIHKFLIGNEVFKHL